MSLAMEGKFIRIYAKYFYQSLNNCLRYWCFMARYCPYYQYTGSHICQCFTDYPSIKQAFDGWSQHVMEQLAEDQCFKEELISKMGKTRAVQVFFGQRDQFTWIRKDEAAEEKLLIELFKNYDWNPKH